MSGFTRSALLTLALAMSTSSAPAHTCPGVGPTRCATAAPAWPDLPSVVSVIDVRKGEPEASWPRVVRYAVEAPVKHRPGSTVLPMRSWVAQYGDAQDKRAFRDLTAAEQGGYALAEVVLRGFFCMERVGLAHTRTPERVADMIWRLIKDARDQDGEVCEGFDLEKVWIRPVEAAKDTAVYAVSFDYRGDDDEEEHRLEDCLRHLSLQDRPPPDVPRPEQTFEFFAPVRPATNHCQRSCAQWPLESATDIDIDFETAWSLVNRNRVRDVKVAVLDYAIEDRAGLNLTKVVRRSELLRAVGVGASPVGPSVLPSIPTIGAPEPTPQHGVRVAQLIAGEGPTYRGAAPGAEILNYEVFPDGDTFGTSVALAMALRDGAQVVNFSGTFLAGRSACFESLLRRARAQKVVVSVAAGNAGVDLGTMPVYPAAHQPQFENLLAAGAFDSRGSRSCFSNHGDAVNIYAPGEGVPFPGAPLIEGTSYSTALVSGVAALVVSQRRKGRQVVDQIVEGAHSFCPGTSSYRLLNAPGALVAHGGRFTFGRACTCQ